MNRLPVLTYHAIGNETSPLAVTRDAFASTMRQLSQAGWRALTEREAADGLTGGSWPARSFLLHFDDGVASVKTVAWPILRDAGFTATVFVVSDWVGRTNDWPGQPPDVPRWPLLTWDDLGELAGDGATLGAHSASHPRLPTLPLEQQREEMVRSFDAIRTRCGERARVFAYPYGAFDRATSALAAELADVAYGTRLALVSPRSPRHALPRVDAYYVRHAHVLDGLPMRAYLSLRHGGRLLRGMLRP